MVVAVVITPPFRFFEASVWRLINTCLFACLAVPCHVTLPQSIAEVRAVLPHGWQQQGGGGSEAGLACERIGGESVLRDKFKDCVRA